MSEDTQRLEESGAHGGNWRAESAAGEEAEMTSDQYLLLRSRGAGVCGEGPGRGLGRG